VEKDLLADWTDYEYDSNGKMVKRSLWLLFKDEPDKKYSDGWYVYTYNDKGDESSISFHGPSGELWQRYEYEYEYDALGRIAKKTVIGPDIKSPDSKTYEYEYDLFGNMIKYGENTYEYEYY
jgi:YD repeat-containing protein